MTGAISSVGGAEGAMAAVQERMSAISARFGVRPAGLSFADQLSRSSGWQGVRRAAGAGAGELAAGLSLDGVSGEDVLTVGRQFLGVPYQWGGTDPSGFDCSGFVQYVYRQLGLELPRVSGDQARAGKPVASLAEALPGDLVAFNSPVDHIGIYAGDGKMIVAPKTGDVVKVQKITEAPVAIRRVLSDPVPAAPTTDLLASILADRAGALGGLNLSSVLDGGLS